MKTLATLIILNGLLALAPAGAADTPEKFSSPENAIKALTAAARAKDSEKRIAAVLGPDSDEIISSGDAVEDAAALKRFVTAAGQRTRIERDADGTTAIAHLGPEAWPFPIPIVRDGDKWRFDTAAGKEELLNRRIGRNELTAISVARTYVDAQHEYAARFHRYAQTLRSTPGKQDGLYWEATGDDESPLGPLVASATAEGYQHAAEGNTEPAPYHGYMFRILTAQGPAAPGGARNYVNNGQMTGGFALIAWPVEPGSSGVMTFIVGEQGVVYQKNLGAGTAEAVKAITTFDPDRSWDVAR